MNLLPEGLEPAGRSARSGFLTPAIRRDVADANRQFLDLALEPVLADDSRFALPDEVSRSLRAGGEDLLTRVAACPFTLFEVSLRDVDLRRAGGSGVEDARRTLLDAAMSLRTHNFAYLAVFLAWRLAGDEPLAFRVVLGLPPPDERLLAATRPSDLTRIAYTPQLIRPRWACHPRYWRLLIRAAASGEAALQRVHCAGICLVVGELRPPDARAGAAAGRAGR